MYNTGNPLGSTSPKDFSDNAEITDRYANDVVNETMQDRFGRSRLTIRGLEKKAQLDIAAGVADATAEAGQYRDQAIAAKNAAQVAAIMSGFSKYADTLAQLEAGIGTDYVDGDVVMVFQDESRDDASAIYKVESGGAVFQNVFDKTRQDLLSFTGTISADAEWSDVPAHSDPAFDAQAQALANRTEYLADRGQQGIAAAKEVLQKKVAELDFGGQFSGDTEIYPGAYKAAQGVAIIETPAGPRLFVSQRSTGESVADERCRIVEFPMSHDGSALDNLGFTQELNIGHGEGIGGRCNPDGSIDIYSMSMLDAQHNTSITTGKGFTITRWRGSGTTDADVRNFFLWGLPGSGHRYQNFYHGTVGSSEDGKYVLLIASSTETSGYTLFAYDVAEVEAAASPLDVLPKYTFKLKNPKPGNAGAVGVCADSNYIYIVYGTVGPLLYQGVQLYSWDGTLVKDFPIDGARGEYTYPELMGHGLRGNPVALENEGATVYKNRLYFIALDTWRSGGDVVSFNGKNYACGGSNISGVYPYDVNWVETTLPASGEFDPSATYNRGTQNRRAKVLMCVASEADAIDGMYTASRVIYPGDVASGARVGRADAGIVYNAPAHLDIKGWSENTKTLRNHFRFANNGYYYMWDSSNSSDQSKFGALRAKYRDGAGFVSLQSFGGAESAGARTVLFNNSDPELRGGLKEFVGANASTPHREVNGYGQTVLRNFNTLKGVSDNASPTLSIRYYGGSNPIQDWCRGDVISATCWATSSTFILVSTSGKNLALGASSGTGPSDSFKRWVIYSTSGTFEPSDDASFNIASAERRVNNSYFAVAPTVSSDERIKSGFRSLTEAEKAAALEIKNNIGLYQLNDAIAIKGADGARWHCGVKAQQVVSILQSHGLDWTRYAFIGYDEWGEQPEVLDEQGGVEQEHRPAGSLYAVKYEELLAFIIAAI